MFQRIVRYFGPCLFGLSLCALIVSTWFMAQRLSHRPERDKRPQYWFQDRIGDADFKFLGEPGSVEMIFQPPVTDPKSAHPVALVVHWRGQSVRFDVGGRDDPRLPGMLRHEDWFRIMPMVEGRAHDQSELLELFKEGKATPRLIAAARYPAEGFDDQTWGLVRRRDWRYRFAEFKIDGPAEDSIRTWDTTYGRIESVVAPGPHDKPITDLSDDDRRQFAWQYDAMIQVTPSTLFRSKDKVVQQGMDAMSWTWPVASISVIGMIIGGLLTFSRNVERHD